MVWRVLPCLAFVALIGCDDEPDPPTRILPGDEIFFRIAEVETDEPGRLFSVVCSSTREVCYSRAQRLCDGPARIQFIGGRDDDDDGRAFVARPELSFVPPGPSTSSIRPALVRCAVSSA